MQYFENAVTVITQWALESNKPLQLFSLCQAIFTSGVLQKPGQVSVMDFVHNAHCSHNTSVMDEMIN